MNADSIIVGIHTLIFIPSRELAFFDWVRYKGGEIPIFEKRRRAMKSLCMVIVLMSFTVYADPTPQGTPFQPLQLKPPPTPLPTLMPAPTIDARIAGPGPTSPTPQTPTPQPAGPIPTPTFTPIAAPSLQPLASPEVAVTAAPQSWSPWILLGIAVVIIAFLLGRSSRKDN